MTHAYEYMNEKINGAINPHIVRYFHGRITREESESRLTNVCPLNGLFLLREHLHLDGYFVLSMCFKGHVKHYVIERQYKTGTVAIEGSLRKFVGPIELVQAYLQHGQYQSTGLPCKLEQPCFLTSGASPRNFTGSSQETMKEELFGIAKSHGLTDQEIGKALNTFKRSEFEKLMKKFVHRNRNWYHGVISKKVAEKRLAKSGLQNGRFLVREKSKNCGRYSLSVCCNSKMYHYNIQRESAIGQVSIEGGGYFDSLLALIDYYEMKTDNLVCSLGEPCARGDKPDNNMTQETIQLAKVFRKILSVGVIRPEDIATVSASIPEMTQRNITDQEKLQRMSPGQQRHHQPRTPGPSSTDINHEGYVNMHANVAVSPSLQHKRLVPLPSIEEDKEEEEDEEKCQDHNYEEDDIEQEKAQRDYPDVFSSSSRHSTVVYNRHYDSTPKYY